MKIDPEKCKRCADCIPFCPVCAIQVKEKKVVIHSDGCVECGVCSLVKEIRLGKRSLEEAADILSKPCVCGVVNTSRARELLQAMG